MSNSQIILNPDQLRSFITSLREKSDNELRNIITRYISYRPEMVEAALIVSVDRGYLSYDLKEKLDIQIMRNFEAQQQRIKSTSWEKDNAFIGYVAIYTDDELYNIINEPSDIVIDVYNAILAVAKERELISESDREGFYEDARKAARSDREIRMDEFREYTKDFVEPEEELTEEEIEKEKQKYWVCPKCHEMVEMEMGVCWNCQTEAPVNVEHPGREKVIREHADRKPFSFTKAGITMISIGVLLIIVGLLHKTLSGYLHYYRWDGIVIGGLAVIPGIYFCIKGASRQ
ncbi:MAG: hypothetical protein ABSA76_01140 [Bacteroidales bacterium]